MMNIQAPSMKRFRHVLWISILALSLVRCGGDDSPSGASQTKFEQLYSGLFTDCGQCHSVAPTDELLVGAPPLVSRDDIIQNLVNKSASNFPDWFNFQATRAGCLNVPFIKPGDASGSLLVAIFDSQVAATMPCNVTNHLISPISMARAPGMLPLLKEWIDEGATR